MKHGILIAMALLSLLWMASCGGDGTQAPNGADRPLVSSGAEQSDPFPVSSGAEQSDPSPVSSGAEQTDQTPEQAGPDTSLPLDEEPEPGPGPVETDTAEDFYQACTSLPAGEVEAFALRVREAFLARDWAALSEYIAYPITVGEVCYEDAAAFRTGDFSDLNQAFYDALEAERCRELFCNWQGILLGDGQVWIGEDGAGELKVTAINP